MWVSAFYSPTTKGVNARIFQMVLGMVNWEGLVKFLYLLVGSLERQPCRRAHYCMGRPPHGGTELGYSVYNSTLPPLAHKHESFDHLEPWRSEKFLHALVEPRPLLELRASVSPQATRIRYEGPQLKSEPRNRRKTWLSLRESAEAESPEKAISSLLQRKLMCVNAKRRDAKLHQQWTLAETPSPTLLLKSEGII